MPRRAAADERGVLLWATEVERADTGGERMGGIRGLRATGKDEEEEGDATLLPLMLPPL
jgi:hypothetical protein